MLSYQALKGGNKMKKIITQEEINEFVSNQTNYDKLLKGARSYYNKLLQTHQQTIGFTIQRETRANEVSHNGAIFKEENDVFKNLLAANIVLLDNQKFINYLERKYDFNYCLKLVNYISKLKNLAKLTNKMPIFEYTIINKSEFKSLYVYLNSIYGITDRIIMTNKLVEAVTLYKELFHTINIEEPIKVKTH